jgi:maltose alpha-D-glucosyltransferase/alpha-amylase
MIHDEIESNPLWYKDAIIYQVHVKAYNDSNGDGIGDFAGLIEKLDYIASLGVTVVWLQPFYPSPLKDDGYDISDYFSINKDYGTIDDFIRFLKEAHSRGVRVITELVLNHTSDQHEWFQRARLSPPGSRERNYYVWSDTPDKYKETRIIFSDFETSNWAWDPVAKAYFWHRFYSHQPDLNYESPDVHENILQAVDFWFNLGIDGMRLDAVPYLYEREGTNCENLPETHAFLKNLNSHIQKKFKNKMLLAEANQWPEDAVAYFGNGDECHMAFHFPVMPRMYMAVQMETRFPIIDILEQTPVIPENCQWAMFLRNHDELTLEMVTDEERDYMYRFFARDNRARINLGIRRRLAPLVNNNRRKIELLNFLLLSFPGTPIIYYGDEIGMGDNYYLGDRNGVRTPMQWSPDRNAGFSDTNPQKLFLPVIIDPEYHYEAINVEIQQSNLSSLLWWMKRAISVRKNYKAFGRGSLEFLSPSNPKVLAFLRKYEDEVILAVANLSRFSQFVELDLSKFAGYIPIEVISRNKFPVIKDQYYVFTLSGHVYYWFSLEKISDTPAGRTERKVPEIIFKDNWKEIFNSDERLNFEKEALTGYISSCDWFHPGEARIRRISIEDTIDLENSNYAVLIVKIDYFDRPSDLYSLMVSVIRSSNAERIRREHSSEIIAHLKNSTNKLLLVNAAIDEIFSIELLKQIVNKTYLKGKNGNILLSSGNRIRQYYSEHDKHFQPASIKIESNEIRMQFGNVFTIKLYRKVEEGINPGEEVLQFLSEKTSFKNIPLLAGKINYVRNDSEPINLALMQEHVTNQGTAWAYVLDSIDRFYENILSKKKEEREEIKKNFRLKSFLAGFEALEKEFYAEGFFDRFFIGNINLLGKRSGELHTALSSGNGVQAFLPEPFSSLYQRSIYQSIRSHIKSTFRLLEKKIKEVDENIREEAADLLNMENSILNHAGKILKTKIEGKKIRIHGDYNLKQILYTGKDFVIQNFEGNLNYPATERRLRRSALRDIAGLIYSLYSATYYSIQKYKSSMSDELNELEPFSILWWQYISGILLKSYWEAAKNEGFLPNNINDAEYLTEIYLLEKALNELSSELGKNTELVKIPLKLLKYLNQLSIEKPVNH